jgi:hypothetical protein
MLHTAYGEALRSPEEVVFSVSLSKAAACTDLVALTTGSTYQPDDLAKLKPNDLRDLFGPEFVERVSDRLGNLEAEKLAEEARTLPRPDAQMLEKLLADAGVQPAAEKAASAPAARFSDAQLAYLAQQYWTGKRK